MATTALQQLATATTSRSTANTQTLTKVRHPEWTLKSQDWLLWRLCYEGGRDYIKTNIKRYSKRESEEDFQKREELTYNPGDATTGVNVFRNSLISKLHEVQRKGDSRWVDICNTDVDLKGNSMSAFMGLEVAPLLMSCAKRIVCVDAPAVDPDATKDIDKGHPYVWAVNAEDLVSWAVDDETDELVSANILESYDVVNPEFGLVTGTAVRYRYFALLEAGTVWKQTKIAAGKSKPVTLEVPTDRDQVLLRLLDTNDKDLCTPLLIDLPRLPVVVGVLPVALLKDVERIQSGSLQLNSTDMSFLFRANFPQQVRQVDTTTRSIRPKASKRPVNTNQEVELADRTVEDQEFRERSEAGPNRAIVHGIGTVPPAYIAPPTDNCKLSMEKQDKMSQQIKNALDQGMVSIGLKQVAQSGASKMMDRLGVDTGLAVVGKVMEGMEREIAEIMCMFLNTNTPANVSYPKDYSVKSVDERLAEANKLDEVKSSIASKTFQNEIDIQKAQTLLQGSAEQETIDTVISEIKAAPWVDFNATRAGIVQADVITGFSSKAFGSKLRGYPDGESDNAAAESLAAANALSGGDTQPITKADGTVDTSATSAPSAEPKPAPVPKVPSDEPPIDGPPKKDGQDPGVVIAL